MSPRLSFTLDAPSNASSGTLERGVSLARFRVVVSDFSGKVVWDSGLVVPSASNQSSLASAVRVPVVLEEGVTYSWTAQWQDTSGRESSPSARAWFDVAVVSTSGWRGAAWVGAGHAEMQTEFALPDDAPLSSLRARVNVAAPGGAVVWVNGRVAGNDSVGIAGWLDWTRATYSRVVDIGPLLVAGTSNKVRVGFGCGAWCPSNVPTWLHSHRAVATPAGGQPLARVLVRIEAPGNSSGGIDIVRASGTKDFSSRPGPVINSSSWLGATINWTLPADEGWETPSRLVPNETLASDVPATTRPLGLPPYGVGSSISATSVQSSGPAYIYEFPAMIVGVAIVRGAGWGGTGVVSIEYCETLLDPAAGTCLRQHGYETNGTVDRHVVSPSANGLDLAPRFSWRGFRYAIVRVEGAATFRGDLGDIVGRWTAVGVEGAGTVTMTAENSPSTLESISDMVRRTHLSNLVTGLPTDCPTREKHGWLGDAMNVARGAMYHFFTPTTYSLFVRQILDAQTTGGPATDGFVPVVVPVHQGVDSASNDISWTAGLATISAWALEFYGDLDQARVAWGPIERWIEGQLRNASSAPEGLPNFATYGDLGSREIYENGTARNEVARAAASANFLLALDSAVWIAKELGERDAEARWSQKLAELREAFERHWWDAGEGSFRSNPGTRQTTNALALAAKAGSPDTLAAAGNILLKNVENENYLLTVGAAGAPRIMQELSGLGDAGHKAAVRVASGTDFPGWGYWVSQGATTCWEAWNDMKNRSYDHYHGSRNHAWLCGGVSEWLFSSLGGITAVAPGFQKVQIAPRVVPDLGPNATRVELATAAGTVVSAWQLGDSAADGALLNLQIEVPVLASEGHVSVPLLTESASTVDVYEGSRLLWDGAAGALCPIQGVVSGNVSNVPGNLAVLRIVVLSGSYNFSVRTR